MGQIHRLVRTRIYALEFDNERDTFELFSTPDMLGDGPIIIERADTNALFKEITAKQSLLGTS